MQINSPYDKKSAKGAAFSSDSFFILLCALVLLTLTFMFIGCSSGKKDSFVEQPTISSARIDKRKSKVQLEILLTKEYVTANKGRTLYLFEILPHQRNLSLNVLEPVEIVKTKEKIIVNVDLAVQNRTRLCSSFIIAEKSAAGEFTPITAAKYIENPDILATARYDYPVQSSKKGLIYDNLADMQALGVSQTIITVDMSKFFLSSGGQGAVPYLYNGVTYYLNKDRLNYLDHEIKVCSDAGVHVFLNIVLGAPDIDIDESLTSLYYNSAVNNTEYYAINADNEVSIAHFQGFINFISERYTRVDREYGFAGSYILGYEVNDNRNHNYAGKMDLEIYLDGYLSLLRTADTIVRSNYAGGRVYISLGNNFTSSVKDATQQPNPQLDYPAKELLTLLSEKSIVGGNFPWHIAINPYPSDPADTEIWSDSGVESTFNTPFITMQNIEVFTEFLSQGSFLYNGETRSIIIGEFGISANPDDETALKKQAAAYAYAYYSAQSNEDIDAFIYKRQRDNPKDAPLYYGLFDQTGTVQKPVAKLFAEIDLETEEDPASFALPIIGVSGWQSVIKNYQEPKSARLVMRDSPVITESKKYKKSNEILYDFTQGSLCNFYPSDNAEYVELRADEHYPSVMYAKLLSKGQYRMMGVSRAYQKPLDLKNAKCITVRIKIDAPSSGLADDTDKTASFTLLMKREGEPDRIYEGNAIVACGKWTDLTFNVSGYLKKTDARIDYIKLLVKGEEADEDYGLWMESLSIYRGSPAVWFVLITLIIILVAAAGFFIYKKQKRSYIRARSSYIGKLPPPKRKYYAPGPPAPPRHRPNTPSFDKKGAPTSIPRKKQGNRSSRRDIFTLGDDR
ncbi:MAG: hypothetical protein GX303_08975 [Clostridiales bacterium]|nr:hypothetical protein [Clostridiales bacterium]